ncbi:MAG: alpha/beta hydrolase fold, partial [uncultured Solirubrobacteraceae bacterium]
GERAQSVDGDRLARAPALAGRPGQGGQRGRDRNGTAAGLRARTVGRLAELARAAAGVLADAPLHRRRPARLRALGHAGREDHDLGLRPLARRAVRRARHRGGRGGRQLDGRVHRRRDRDQVPAPHRAARARQRRRTVDRAHAQRRRPALPRGHREPRTDHDGPLPVQGRRAGPPAARSPPAAVVRRRAPARDPAGAGQGADGGREQAGLRPRARRADELSDPRPPVVDRVPDADPLGPQGHPRPDQGRLRVRPAHPRLAPVGLRRHGPRADDRAPRALQRRPPGVPRRAGVVGGRAGRRRGGPAGGRGRRRRGRGRGL